MFFSDTMATKPINLAFLVLISPKCPSNGSDTHILRHEAHILRHCFVFLEVLEGFLLIFTDIVSQYPTAKAVVEAFIRFNTDTCK